MGISERKERERQEMRDLIVEKATQVFIELGYEKASIRTIAERIEYSPATIYLYFKDKDWLFLEVQSVSFGLLLKEFEKTQTIEDPIQRLHALGKAYLDFGIANPAHYELMFINKEPVNCIQKDEVEWHNGMKVMELFRSTLQSCIDAGKLKITNIDIAAFAIWGMVHGMVSLYVTNHYQVMDIPDEVARMMVYQSLDATMELLKA
ncbi:MAG: TetR/AcrR family transcriptional regulator [Bacteroidetes bacterium]|nr:TetR/AcrR family transcriptional regulator [Bacteroidota bacterium]